MNKSILRAIKCGICVILTCIIVFSGVLDVVDKTAEDMFYHNAGKIESSIKIIKIDDKTMNKLGDFSTWSRDIYTQILDKLYVSDDVRPAVIGFDILFSNEKDETPDANFVNVCKKHNNIVTGMAYVFKNDIMSDENGNIVVNGMTISDKIEPYKALKEVTSQGFVNALMDEDDSIIRSSFLYFNEGEGVISKSFSAMIYEKYMHSIGKEIEYPTDKEAMAFRYSGKPGEYENVSLLDVLEGKVPAEAFDDCIVLVGAYAAGMMDAYFVPVDKSQQMYGVEIHANVIQALLENKTLEVVPNWIEALLTVIVVLALVLICEKLSVVKIIILSVAVILTRFVVGWILFNNGYSGSVLTLPVMVTAVCVYYIVHHYYVARNAKRRIEKAFNKYVAPQIVDEISKEGKYELKLGGEKRDVAVLFVDIRGFTPLSECIEPEQVVDILNGYLELTTQSIFRHGGTLDKFIGDATMAVFNAPFDTDDYVYRAVLTAWDIVQGGERIEKEYLMRYGKHVGFGVGINCGPAVVGNIGCDFRMDYTAIGDTVNTAARLESNAPKGKVYISQDVYEQLKGRIEVESIGEIPLKGKSKGIFVYSITDVKGYKSPESA